MMKDTYGINYFALSGLVIVCVLIFTGLRPVFTVFALSGLNLM